jgi:hypothetical protein
LGLVDLEALDWDQREQVWGLAVLAVLVVLVALYWGPREKVFWE